MEKINNTELVQYLYQETDDAHNKLIESALENDWILKEEYIQLESTMNELKNLSFSPQQSTVDRILNYARSLEKCS